MKILKRILILLVMFVAVVVGVALTKPDSFRVERKALIKADAAKVYPYLANFKNWGAWSPWEHLDTKMTKKLSGAKSGKGAVYEWTGNNKVGQGKMEILEAEKNESVKMRLTFIKPFAAVNTTEYTLAEKDDATEVTWIMYGPNSFVGKMMSVFMSMDKMIGKDFEKGLANLKAVVEKPKDEEE